MSQGGAAAEGEQTDEARPRIGSLLQQLIRSGRSFSGRERHCFFLNTRTPRFANASACSGLDLADDGRGAAIVDWDFDGDLDLWLSNRNGPQVRYLRNDVPKQDAHFLAIKLEGRTINRDAIGARVELKLNGDPGPRWIATVRAGDGYLSQSSKWLHFGLGPVQQIDQVTIRWSRDNVQTYSNCQAGRFYRAVEGEPTLIDVPACKPSTVLAEGPVENVPDSATARIVLTTPLASPSVPWCDWQGQTHALLAPQAAKRPVLISLWGSWCQPCLEELSDWSQRARQPDWPDLQVIAAAVDGVADQNGTEAEAKSAASRLQLPFLLGTATPELLDRLQQLHNRTVELHVPLPLPSSFLFDARGRLAVIYRGPVSLSQLRDDVTFLEKGPAERRIAAVPFPGRWAAGVKRPRLMPIVLDALRDGNLVATKSFIEANQAELDADPRYDILLYNVGQAYLAQKDRGHALEHFEAALQKNPQLADAHYNAGMVKAMDGRFAAASEHMRQYVLLNPQDPRGRMQLGRFLARAGQLELAAEHLQAALRLHPQDGVAHLELSLVYAKSGHLAEAIACFQTARASDARIATPAIEKQFLEAAEGALQALDEQGPEQQAQAAVWRKQLEALNDKSPIRRAERK